MSQDVWMQPPQNVRRGGRGWLHVLWVGIVLFVVATIVMFLTRNPNLYPTVILIGNFLVPVVFVAFLYDHQHLSSLTPETIAKSFGIGGILGVLGASVLEALLISAPSNSNQGFSLSSAMLVGLIEEGCKIAAVIFLARRMPHRAAIDGLLLGAAVGMGFAALESTGLHSPHSYQARVMSEHRLPKQCLGACSHPLVMVSGAAFSVPSCSVRAVRGTSASPAWSS